MTTPRTIAEALLDSAGSDEGEHVFHLVGGEHRLPAAELAERALRGARRLAALGVEPGDAVGILGSNRPEWVVWAFATWLAGAALVPIPIPVRIRDPHAFRARLHALTEAGGCRCVLAERRLAAMLPAHIAVPWGHVGDDSADDWPAPPPEAIAVIQFTSGSTAQPKGAQISHAAVMAQIDLLRRVYLYSDGRPRAVLSWTPFFHDLGLFANLAQPAATGSTTHHLPTERFARDPAEWLRLVETTRVAVTVAPSAAFGSAMRKIVRRGERVDLASLDVAYFAAEAIDPTVASLMTDTADRFGFRPEALGGTYGLAEAVMGVSFAIPGTGLRVDRVSVRELAARGVAAPPADGAPERLIVSSGLPQMEVRVVGPEGSLPERQVGEIQVRGPSLMSGYAGTDVPDPFLDGWLCTGDLGYLADGELYVSGRVKDMMVAMGHNYYPEDFEWAAARVEGVRPGRCVAFTAMDDERVVVLVEPRDGHPAAMLQREVARSVSAAVGVAPGEVVVLPPGTVEKTTSGKLRRAAMREAYAAGEFAAGAAL